MYPAPSDFSRNLPGGSAHWSLATAPGLVYVSQWDAIVRQLQVKLQQLIPMGFYVDPEVCAAGGASSVVRALPSLFSGETYHSRANIRTTGVLDAETYAGLRRVLCTLSLPDRYARLRAEQAQRVVSPETVRDAIWVAFHVQPPGAGGGAADYRLDFPAANVVIPRDATMPAFQQPASSAPADRFWVAAFRPADESPPPSPAARGLPADPGPTNRTRGRWVVAGIVAGAVGAVWWSASQP